MGYLDGKVAIVTGGGRGLGRAHALSLAREGAAVVVNDLGGDFEGVGSAAGPAQEVVNEIVAAGGRAVADTTDVSDWDAVGGIVELALASFGRLDSVVNNAGISKNVPLSQVTAQEWQRGIAVNLGGAAALCHWAAAHWREKGPEAGRRIINTTSTVGLTIPGPGAPVYGVAMAGIAALTISAALELADLGVRANALSPVARTRMSLKMAPDLMKPVEQGFDRMDPENVSAVAVYLASPLCKFTGRIFASVADHLDLFEGWTVSHHLENAQQRWSPETLQAALADIPAQQHGMTQHKRPHTTPSDAALEALEAIERAGDA